MKKELKIVIALMLCGVDAASQCTDHCREYP